MKVILLKQEEVHTGDLILVNQEYEYQEQISNLSPIGRENREEILLNHRAGILLNQLMTEIGGWEHIAPVSAWRSWKEQQEIWDHSLEENGLEFTETYVAVPGHSEHQTGLAIDLGLKRADIDFIRPDFPYEGICQVFRKKAIKYGFVERYPAGREQITKIGHEPWHFRYVGTPHAAVMAEKGLVLEEYITFLRGYGYGQRPYVVQTAAGEVMVSYVKAEGSVTRLEIEDAHPYAISGNNVDGFVVTEWRQANENKR